MNKTQFITLGGALLASTALSSAASAGTIGKFADDGAGGGGAFTTTAVSISNAVFSTTASTANSVVIGSSSNRKFGMRYSNTYLGGTRFSTEFTLSGARFVQASLLVDHVAFKFATQASGTAGGADALASATAGTEDYCVTQTALVELFVVDDCRTTAVGGSFSTGISAIYFTGVTFNNASGLATVGSSVTMTGRVFNPASPTQVYESSSTGTILTSAAPMSIVVTAGDTVTASATATPVAFAYLTAAQAQETGILSVRLATVTITANGVFQNDLTTASDASNLTTTSVTVSSTALSGASVSGVSVYAGANGFTTATAANFNGGSITFVLNNTDFIAADSFHVTVSFSGTAAIPAAVAGTVSGTADAGEQNVAVSGATAAINQGGFRAEVNTFNASTNGPFSSYLRIHNNGVIAGTVTVTLKNDDHTSGATLGSSFTTAEIQPGGTMQLSAAEMEDSAANAKLPSGGADVPAAERVGSYTINVSGPIIGYVQHILFDGDVVADLSSFRNDGQTADAP